MPNDSRKMIVVWFSCGAASAVAAKLTLEKYGSTHQIRVVNQPIYEEDSDNRRFLNDVDHWLGGGIIEQSHHPKYPTQSCVDVWNDRKYMSGVAGAPCTLILKKQNRQHWEKRHKPDFHVLGFTSDEKKRYERFIASERSNVLPILIDEGLNKHECMQILYDAKIKPPRVYAMGLPNANCIGCVKSQSPTYWNLIRTHFPAVFEDRSTQSRRIGCKLVTYKGDRLYLDELPADAKGGSLKKMPDCGLFCEEYADSS